MIVKLDGVRVNMDRVERYYAADSGWGVSFETKSGEFTLEADVDEALEFIDYGLSMGYAFADIGTSTYVDSRITSIKQEAIRNFAA